jgi:hypothetical protein
MMTLQKPTCPPDRPPREPRSRGPSAMLLVALAVLLLSVGFGLTLHPQAGDLGLLILVPAGILLLIGLEGTVRDDLDAEC